MTNITKGQASLLARAWACLCRGNVRVVRAFSDESRHYVEFEHVQRRGLCDRELACLLPVLLGTPQKVVAADTFRSVSAIAGTVSCALQAIGLGCRASDIPMIAVMSAFAATHLGTGNVDAIPWLDGGAEQMCLLGVSRPEATLRGALTPCEYRVVTQRLAGHSHEKVAQLVGVSPRTVANQIASAYRKLGVSARLELMNRILADGLPKPQRFGRDDATGQIYPGRNQRTRKQRRATRTKQLLAVAYTSIRGYSVTSAGRRACSPARI